MLDEGRNTIDRILIAGSLVGAIAVSILLWRDDLLVHYFAQNSAGDKEIGTIVNAKNDVRRRMQQSLTWYPARSTETLYERDSLFTGSESEISFRVGENGELLMGADSLVVLETKGNDLVFDLRLGNLSTNATGTQKIKLMHAGQVTTIEAGPESHPLSISKSDNGKLKILSATGAVSVKSGGKSEQLEKNQTLEIDTQKQWSKETFSAQIKSHKIKDQVWLAVGESLPFTWQMEEKSGPVVFEIAKDAKFKTKLLSLEKQNTSHLWGPVSREQDIFVRLVDPVTLKTISATHRIELLDKGPVRLILPDDESNLYSQLRLQDGETKVVEFLWSSKRGANGYEIQLAKDKEFNSLVGGKVVSQPKYQSQLLGGIYYWRARSVSSADEHDWSPVRRFAVGQDAILSVPYGPEKPSIPYGPELPSGQSLAQPSSGGPKPETKIQKVVLQFDPAASARNPAADSLRPLNPPLLKWQIISEGRDYQIEFSDTKEFKNSTKTPVVKSNSYSWKEAKPGRYYWRANELDGAGNILKTGEPARLDLSVEKPIIIDPNLKSETVQDADLLEASQNVDLKWKPVPFAKSYRVVEDGVEYDALVTEATIALVPNVKKEVQIAAVDSKGKLISDFAKQSLKLERKLAMVIPQPKLPAHKSTIVAFSSSNMEPLLFVWSAAEGAELYDLQFATDANFKNILKEESVDKNKFLLKNPLHNGAVYWRVRARYGTAISDWSEARIYSVQTSE